MRFIRFICAALIALSVPIAAAAEESVCGEHKEILKTLKDLGEEVVGRGVVVKLNERAEKERGALVTITAAPWSEKNGSFSILGTEPSVKKETCIARVGLYWKTLGPGSRARLRTLFPALFTNEDTVSGGLVNENFILLLIVRRDGAWEFRRLFAQVMMVPPPVPAVILSGEGWESVNNGGENGGGL